MKNAHTLELRGNLWRKSNRPNARPVCVVSSANKAHKTELVAHGTYNLRNMDGEAWKTIVIHLTNEKGEMHSVSFNGEYAEALIQKLLANIPMGDAYRLAQQIISWMCHDKTQTVEQMLARNPYKLQRDPAPPVPK